MATKHDTQRSAKPQKGRLLKAECPGCEMIVYVSRGADIRHGLPSCGCGMRMFFASLEVALEATPELAHEHPDYADWTRRQLNAASRDVSRRGIPMRCGGCNAWISATNERHSCGFHNEVRGNRNFGGWVEGSSRVSAAMPF
jgi:hypothetical protein